MPSRLPLPGADVVVFRGPASSSPELGAGGYMPSAHRVFLPIDVHRRHETRPRGVRPRPARPAALRGSGGHGVTLCLAHAEERRGAEAPASESARRPASGHPRRIHAAKAESVEHGVRQGHGPGGAGTGSSPWAIASGCTRLREAGTGIARRSGAVRRAERRRPAARRANARDPVGALVVARATTTGQPVLSEEILATLGQHLTTGNQRRRAWQSPSGSKGPPAR